MKTAEVEMPGGVKLELDYPDEASDEQINASIVQLQRQGHLQKLYEAAFKQRAAGRVKALKTGFPLAGGEKGENRYATPEFTERTLAEQGTSLSDPMRAIAGAGTPAAVLTGLERGTLGQIPAIGGSLANLASRVTGIDAFKENAKIAEAWQRKEEEMATISSTVAKSKGGAEIAGFFGDLGGGLLSGAGEGKVITVIGSKMFPSLAARMVAEPFKAGVKFAAQTALPVEAVKGAAIATGYPEGATPAEKKERAWAGLQQFAVGGVGSLAGGYLHAKGLQRSAAEAAAKALRDETFGKVVPQVEEVIAETPSAQVHAAGSDGLADIVARAREVAEGRAKSAESLAKQAGEVREDPRLAEFQLANEKLDGFAAAKEAVRKATADADALTAEFLRHAGQGYFKPTGDAFALWRFTKELQEILDSPDMIGKKESASLSREGIAAGKAQQAEVLRKMTGLLEQFKEMPEVQKQIAASTRQYIEAVKSGKAQLVSRVGPLGVLADHASAWMDGALEKMMKTDPDFERLMREYSWHRRTNPTSERAQALASNLISRIEHEAGVPFDAKATYHIVDTFDSVADRIYKGIPDHELVGMKAPPKPVRQTAAQFIADQYLKQQVDDDPRLANPFDLVKEGIKAGYKPAELNAAITEMITEGVNGARFYSHAYDYDVSTAKSLGFTPEQLEAVPTVLRWDGTSKNVNRHIAGLVPEYKTYDDGVEFLRRLSEFSKPPKQEVFEPGPDFAPLPEIPSVQGQQRPLTLPEYEQIRLGIQEKLQAAVTKRTAALKDFLVEAASLGDYLGVKVDLEKLMDWDPRLERKGFEGKFEGDLNKWFEQSMKAQAYWSQRAEANMKVAADLAIKENALRIGAPLEGQAPQRVTLPKDRTSLLSRKERKRMSELSSKMTDDDRLRFQVAVRAAANTVDYQKILQEMEAVPTAARRGANEFDDAVLRNEAAAKTSDLPAKTRELTDDLMKRGTGKPFVNLTPGEKTDLRPGKDIPWGARLAVKVAGLTNLLKLNFAKGLLSDAEMKALAAAQKATGELDRQQGATQWFLKQLQRPEGGYDRDTSMAVFLALEPGGAEKLQAVNAKRIAAGQAPAYSTEFVEMVGKVGAWVREIGREAKAQELWDPDAQMRVSFLPRILNGDAKQLSTLSAALKEEARKGGYGWDSPRIFRSIYDLADKQGMLPKTMDFREVIAFYVDAVHKSIQTNKLIKYAIDEHAVMEPEAFLKAAEEGKVKFKDWVHIEDGRFMKREIYQPMAGLIGPMGGGIGQTRAGAEIMGIRNIRFSGDFNIPLQLMRAFAMHPIKMFDAAAWRQAFDPDPANLTPELQAIQRAGGRIAMGGEHYERPQSFRKSYIEEGWSKTINLVFHTLTGKFGKKGAFDILSTSEVDPFGQAQLSYFAPAIKRMFYQIEYQRALDLKARGDKFFGRMTADEIAAHIVGKVEPALMNGQINLAGISPRAQDTLRFFFGAPSWNLAILKNMANAVEELGGVVKTGSLSNTIALKNTLAQMMMTAAAAQTVNMLLSYARGEKSYTPQITDTMDLFMVDLGIPDPNRKAERKSLGLNLLGPAFRYWSSLANVVAYSAEMKNKSATQLAQPWLYEGARVTKNLLNPAFQVGVDFMAPNSTIFSLAKTSAAEEQLFSDVGPVSWRTLAEYMRDGYLPDRALEMMLYEGTGIGRKTSSTNQTVLMDFANLQNSVNANMSRIKADVEQKHPEAARKKVEEAVKMMDDFRQRWETTDYWPIFTEKYSKLGRQIIARSR